MTRNFAQDTQVSVSCSRAEIDVLLRKWGCAAIAWSDNYAMGWAQLSFAWKREGDLYLAKFRIKIPDEKALREKAAKLAREPHRRRTTEQFYEQFRQGLGKVEHRLLLLWIKAALNAVEAGIVPAEAIFLPFLVGQDGRTVGEVALPRLPNLLRGAADSLLLGAGPEGVEK